MSTKNIPIFIQYMPDIPHVTYNERKTFLTQQFSKVAAVLAKHKVETSAMGVLGQIITGTMPEENFAPLAKELRKKKFVLGHKEYYDATL